MNEPRLDGPLENVIDQIVDGALAPAQLRSALGRLDLEPDGWKRCTLAFLEAQCWRDAFRALEAASTSRPSGESGSIQLRHVTLARSRMGWWQSAAAAGIVVASFALGWLSHISRPREPAGPGLPVSSSPIVAREAADASTERVIAASGDASAPDRSDDRFGSDRPPPDPGEIVQTVAQLQIGPEEAGATVPILAGPGIDGDWLNSQPPPLSEHEQIVLQRHGYQVDQRRRLLIATLADGRRVSVPIDQVEVRYTGHNPL